MSTIFARIISGELPSYKVYEDDNIFAFLDIRPMVKGHTLVIPKKEVDYIFDLEDALYLNLLAGAKKIAAGVKRAVPCLKVGMAVVGLEVPHAHIHLMPINKVSDLSFKNPVVSMTEAEMKTLAALIAGNIV